MLRKLLSLTVIVSFFLTSLGPLPQAHADATLDLPQPGTMVNLSPAYDPVIIKGLTVHKDNPFLFDFIVDIGQDKASGDALKKEGEKLIKYFLAGLAIPDKDLWVNLSPYEKYRMVPEVLGKTDMGRDLLEQDYILKQITASLIYPEKELGKNFWDKVYAEAQRKFGTTQVPVNTFNKVWILADKAEVFEHNQTAFVVGCHLKVMLEEDYLALQKHSSKNISAPDTTHSIASKIVRQIVLPELEKEVNRGKNFANLRQIFNSIILSSWYKMNLKEALLTQVYANRSKVKGIDLNDPAIKEQIYEQYLKAYKKGVFNYIKEDVNSAGAMIPRKYFSGGTIAAVHPAMITNPAMGTKLMAEDRDGGHWHGFADLHTALTNTQAMSNEQKFLQAGDFVPQLGEFFSGALDNPGSPAYGLSYLPSSLYLSKDLKPGNYIGLDWSGTNLRITLVNITAGQEPRVIAQTEPKVFPEALKENSEESKKALLKFIADGINELPLQEGTPYHLGLVFAFPMDHKAANSGIVTRLTKGWKNDWIIGEDAGKLLQGAIDQDPRLRNKQISVDALMNDTVATQKAVPGAVIGVILGTGFNFSIIDKNGQIINLEAGNFFHIPSELITDIDEDIFKNSEPEGRQRFEKMVSGKYLIEIFHKRLRELAQERSSGNFNAIDQASWKDVDSSLLGELVIMKAKSRQEVSAIINKVFHINIDLTDAEALALIDFSTILQRRAGSLLGSLIGRALQAIDQEQHWPEYKIAIDGSVFRKNKIVQDAFWMAMDMYQWDQKRVKVILPENASALGGVTAAAGIAAVEKRENASASRTDDIIRIKQRIVRSTSWGNDSGERTRTVMKGTADQFVARATSLRIPYLYNHRRSFARKAIRERLAPGLAEAHKLYDALSKQISKARTGMRNNFHPKTETDGDLQAMYQDRLSAMSVDNLIWPIFAQAWDFYKRTGRIPAIKYTGIKYESADPEKVELVYLANKAMISINAGLDAAVNKLGVTGESDVNDWRRLLQGQLLYAVDADVFIKNLKALCTLKPDVEDSVLKEKLKSNLLTDDSYRINAEFFKDGSIETLRDSLFADNTMPDNTPAAKIEKAFMDAVNVKQLLISTFPQEENKEYRTALLNAFDEVAQGNDIYDVFKNYKASLEKAEEPPIAELNQPIKTLEAGRVEKVLEVLVKNYGKNPSGVFDEKTFENSLKKFLAGQPLEGLGILRKIEEKEEKDKILIKASHLLAIAWLAAHSSRPINDNVLKVIANWIDGSDKFQDERLYNNKVKLYDPGLDKPTYDGYLTEVRAKNKEILAILRGINAAMKTAESINIVDSSITGSTITFQLKARITTPGASNIKYFLKGPDQFRRDVTEQIQAQLNRAEGEGVFELPLDEDLGRQDAKLLWLEVQIWQLRPVTVRQAKLPVSGNHQQAMKVVSGEIKLRKGVVLIDFTEPIVPDQVTRIEYKPKGAQDADFREIYPGRISQLGPEAVSRILISLQKADYKGSEIRVTMGGEVKGPQVSAAPQAAAQESGPFIAHAVVDEILSAKGITNLEVRIAIENVFRNPARRDEALKIMPEEYLKQTMDDVIRLNNILKEAGDIDTNFYNLPKVRQYLLGTASIYEAVEALRANKIKPMDALYMVTALTIWNKYQLTAEGYHDILSAINEGITTPKIKPSHQKIALSNEAKKGLKGDIEVIGALYYGLKDIAQIKREIAQKGPSEARQKKLQATEKSLRDFRRELYSFYLETSLLNHLRTDVLDQYISQLESFAKTLPNVLTISGMTELKADTSYSGESALIHRTIELLGELKSEHGLDVIFKGGKFSFNAAMETVPEKIIRETVNRFLADNKKEGRLGRVIIDSHISDEVDSANGQSILQPGPQAHPKVITLILGKAWRMPKEKQVELEKRLRRAFLENGITIPELPDFVVQALMIGNFSGIKPFNQAGGIFENGGNPVNNAMSGNRLGVTQQAPWVHGGIDLSTSNNLTWKISRDGQGVEMNVNPAMIARFRKDGISSLSPFIFRVTTIANIWPVVGVQAPANG